MESRKGTRHKKGKEEASEIEEIINECRVIEMMKGKTVKRDWSIVLSERSN